MVKIFKGGDINEEKNFRITIDDDLKYFLFDDKSHGESIGQENYARVETKIPVERINSDKARMIREILNESYAEQVISKKDMAYNFLSEYLRDKSQKQVQKSDTEIEAKLLLDRENQYVFHRIKRDVCDGEIKGFKIPENFPWTLEGGKLHQYLITPEKDYVRISIKGKSKKIITKENSEIVKDCYGLNCIIKRNELKSSLSPELPLLPSIMLYRKRKYFIAENEKTKNSYCILIDRCNCDSKELFQMEIEGLLLNPSKCEETKIINDIAYLTSKIIEKYPVLKPTAMTKLEWLRKAD